MKRGPDDLRVIAVDWSGAKKSYASRIWLAEIVGDRLVTLEDGRTRSEVVELLLERAESYPNLVVGLDFAFSFPKWFLDYKGVRDARALWDKAASEGEQWLEGSRPFYRKGKFSDWEEAGNRSELRKTDIEVGDLGPIKPESVFKLVGPTQVGPGSIRGMPHLLELSDSLSIWPFDDPALPLLVEIYPRALYPGRVTKSSHMARLRFLEDHLTGGIPSKALRERAACSSDSFDAVISAWRMWEHRAELLELEPGDRVAKIEGQIWIPRGKT